MPLLIAVFRSVPNSSRMTTLWARSWIAFWRIRPVNWASWSDMAPCLYHLNLQPNVSLFVTCSVKEGEDKGPLWDASTLRSSQMLDSDPGQPEHINVTCSGSWTRAKIMGGGNDDSKSTRRTPRMLVLTESGLAVRMITCDLG
jgi:hypothetical protein